jgi:hypothetical protein
MNGIGQNNPNGSIEIGGTNSESIPFTIGSLVFALFVFGVLIKNIWEIMHHRRPFLVCFPLCCLRTRFGCFGLFPGGWDDRAVCAPSFSDIIPAAALSMRQVHNEQNDTPFEQPGYEQTGYEQPGYEQPGYDSDSRGRREYGEPGGRGRAGDGAYQQYEVNGPQNRGNSMVSHVLINEFV